MVVGGRHLGGGSGGGGGGGDDGGARGRRSRANSPLVPPNGVLTPTTGNQNVNSSTTSSSASSSPSSASAQCSKMDNATPTTAKADSTKNSDSLLKTADAVKTAGGTVNSGGDGRRSLSPLPHPHHAPPIDPDLRSKNNSGDRDHLLSLGGGGSPGSSSGNVSHHAQHHLLPPSTPLHHHHHHHHHHGDSDSDAESDSGMRIGDDYQAVIPEFDPDSKPESNYDAMLVWAPKPDLNEQKLDDYVTLAKEKYGYNAEQALGMLFWHKYNVERAMTDLANFTPYPDDWSVEDKVLFEQAFSFHGKVFHRIRQMLPDKSIASLVKYYYSWKKTRFRTSVMDRQARKLQAGAMEESDHSVDENANAESRDSPEEMDINEKVDGSLGPTPVKSLCSNCSVTTSHLNVTSKGSQLCSICYSYWRRTGLMRSTIGPTRRPAHGHGATQRDDSGLFNKGAAKPNPPKDMNLEQTDLDLFTIGPATLASTAAAAAPAISSSSSQSSAADAQPAANSSGSQVFSGSYGSDGILKSLEGDVITLKRQVQSNKQLISQHKQKMSGPSAVALASETFQGSGVVEGLDALLNASVNTDATFTALSRVTMRWSNEELLLAVQGVREHGQDFKAIAEVLGTKSESQVRSFYTNYKRRYHLDDVYAEYLSSGAAKKLKTENDDGAATFSCSSSSHLGATEEGGGVESASSDAAADDAGSVTMIDVKEEESNSSVDSFISAADAAELNEKMTARAAAAAAAAADDAAKRKGKDGKLTLKPNSLSVAGKRDGLESGGKAITNAKGISTTTKGVAKTARETTPPTTNAATSRTSPDDAPDTPDSSNEATPTRRSSFGNVAAAAAASNGSGTTASVGSAKETTTATNKTAVTTTVKGNAKGGGEMTTRPTRTSVSKTVMT